MIINITKTKVDKKKKAETTITPAYTVVTYPSHRGPATCSRDLGSLAL